MNAGTHKELSVDARMLIYAAFKDQAKVVSLLLDSGFDEKELDVLIALELQRCSFMLYFHEFMLYFH